MDESAMFNGGANRAGRFPPQELLAKSFALINAVKISNLESVVATRDNMAALGQMPDMIIIMGGATAAFKLQMICWIGILAAIACAWAFSWWILVAALALIVVERRRSAVARRTWKFLAAVLLSLEILANDFAGWGSAEPEAQRAAIRLMGGPRQAWLDLILPRRSELDGSLLKRKFGPERMA